MSNSQASHCTKQFLSTEGARLSREIEKLDVLLEGVTGEIQEINQRLERAAMAMQEYRALAPLMERLVGEGEEDSVKLIGLEYLSSVMNEQKQRLLQLQGAIKTVNANI